MQLKPVLISFLLLSLLQIGNAQEKRFSINIFGNYGFVPFGDNTTYDFGSIIGEETDFKTKTNGHFGYGIIGKARLITKKRWSYSIGVGIDYQSFESSVPRLSNKELELVNIHELEDGDININPNIFDIVDIFSTGGDSIGVIGGGGSSTSNPNSEITETLEIIQNLQFDRTEYSQLFFVSLIPAELEFQALPKKLSLFAHTQIRMLIWSLRQYDIIEIPEGTTSTVSDNSGDYFNNFSLGITGGLTWHFNDNFSVFASYQKGLTDIYNNETIKIASKSDFVNIGLSHHF